MSFWTLSTGETVAQEKEFDMGGGKIQPIPDGTRAASFIEEAKETEYQGNRYFNLKWKVAEGEYKNRIVFQKLYVFDADASRKDKAKQMLMAINMNCNGKLHDLKEDPTDMDLMTSLCNKPMMVEYAIWELDDKSKSGNWVRSVGSMSNSKPSSPTQQATQSNEPPIDFGGDIPF